MSQQLSDIRRVVSSTAVYALAGLAQRSLAFVLLPLYTRLLEPAEYGVLELVTAFSSFAFAVLMMGLPSAVNKCYHRDAPSPELQRRILPTALWLGIPVMAAGTVILGFCAEGLSRFLIGTDSAADLLRLGIAGGALSSATAVVLASLRARERAVAFALLTLLQFGLAMTLNILLVVKFGMGIRGILWGNLVSHAVAFIVSLVVTLPESRFRPSGQLGLPLLSFGLLLVPVMLSGWVIDLSDRYVLRLFASLDEVAVYGVGYKIAMILQFAIVWPFQLAWPVVSFSISNREGHHQTYARTATYFAATLVYAAVALSLVSRVGVPVLVGEGFAEAYRIIPLICLALVFNGMHFCMSPGVHVSGKTKVFLPLTLIAASLNLGLNFLLVPRFGMFGAAWATVAAFLALALGTWLTGQRYYPIPYEYKRLAKIGLMGLAVYAIGIQVPAEITAKSIVWYAVVAVVGFPLVLLLTGFLEDRERSLVKQVVNRWRPHPKA